LFIANDHDIKIINFKAGGKSDQIVEIVPKPGEFSTYTLPSNNRLHGFFENTDSMKNEFLLLIVENSQHIIDFAKLKFVGGDSLVSDVKL
jgi:hypothetical protein